MCIVRSIEMADGSLVGSLDGMTVYKVDRGSALLLATADRKSTASLEAKVLGKTYSIEAGSLEEMEAALTQEAYRRMQGLMGKLKNC